MSATEAQINRLLKQLEELHARGASTRREVNELEQAVALTRSDYEQKLGQPNGEAERLRVLKASLEARLRGSRRSAPPTPAPTPRVKPPPVTFTPQVEERVAIAPPPPPKSFKRERKAALRDFIYYFSESEQASGIEQINAMLDDERRDIGDILELVEWGDIWKVRSDWETLDEQQQRLEGWQAALEERLAYWQHRLEQSNNPFHELWLKRKAMTRPAWLSFLDELARRQAQQNQELAGEVAALEQLWQAKQDESEPQP